MDKSSIESNKTMGTVKMKSKKKDKSKNKNKNLDIKSPESPMEISPEVSNNWVLRPVAGSDLTSSPVVVTPDSRYVVVITGDKVGVYSSQSGQVVRSLNTGPALAVQIVDNSQIIVATRQKVCVWDFQSVKIVQKFNLYQGDGKTDFKKRVGELRDIFIPSKFLEMFELFLSGEKGGVVSLYRLDVRGGGQANKIFNSVNVGSVHIG